MKLNRFRPYHPEITSRRRELQETTRHHARLRDSPSNRFQMGSSGLLFCLGFDIAFFKLPCEHREQPSYNFRSGIVSAVLLPQSTDTGCESISSRIPRVRWTRPAQTRVEIFIPDPRPELIASTQKPWVRLPLLLSPGRDSLVSSAAIMRWLWTRPIRGKILF